MQEIDNTGSKKPETKHVVNYELTWTRNMGNFESLKVTVGLSADGYGNPDPTMAKVRAWVEDNLGTAVEEVTQAVKG
ncbi:hypothetical protein SEA_SHAM_50 [Streptomyces phage Sham]|jgi:hypothetical protein|uniref:Uncharacterized protein n=1 Tax=Streptomyces phage TunaTartare TaxID=2848887 RepID=A0A8F2IWE2_9CAUD|nr:hypothetical protein PP457_gp198 [Streptomyces phage TunaTartare]QWT29944.1 hypothetical protein SEA_TUNATARTARE_52 [Streptomyces phage TunaTartare]UUG69385.1 hypothetical protein SEA_SHAM_50 [Streptomyces phage Sham]